MADYQAKAKARGEHDALRAERQKITPQAQAAYEKACRGEELTPEEETELRGD